MHIHPNQTLIDAEVVAVTSSPDGFGAEVELKVARNASPDSDADFIRPKPGAHITVFTAQAKGWIEGQQYRVRLRLNAGPRGGRIVVEQSAPLKD